MPWKNYGMPGIVIDRLPLIYASVPPSCAAVRGNPRRESSVMGKDGKDACRISVTFTRQQYAEIERLSKKQGLSKSWFVRRAAERLIEIEEGGPRLPLGDNHAQR
jgi:Ribbon-helix-helix protein, copG family